VFAAIGFGEEFECAFEIERSDEKPHGSRILTIPQWQRQRVLVGYQRFDASRPENGPAPAGLIEPRAADFCPFIIHDR
jgi:hypothetical protein